MTLSIVPQLSMKDKVDHGAKMFGNCLLIDINETSFLTVATQSISEADSDWPIF